MHHAILKRLEGRGIAPTIGYHSIHRLTATAELLVFRACYEERCSLCFSVLFAQYHGYTNRVFSPFR